MHCDCNTTALVEGCSCTCHVESLDQAIQTLFLEGLISITCTDEGVGYLPTQAGITLVEALK